MLWRVMAIFENFQMSACMCYRDYYEKSAQYLVSNQNIKRSLTPISLTLQLERFRQISDK